MPIVIVIAGPNGAGKTTFAREYLAADERRFSFVNADEIARDLAAGDGAAAMPTDMAAGRMMLARIDDLVAAGADFAIETTLATRIYAQRMPGWQRKGYVVSLVYLKLASVEDSLARVRKRVAAGGHAIPEPVIRRRFSKSWAYFNTIYRPLADEWYVWSSKEGTFTLMGAWDGRRSSRS